MEKEYFFKTDQLVIWRPSGILDINKIYDFINFLNTQSEQRDPHFSRFIDLSQIAGISVKFQDLYPVTQQRKNYHRASLKQTVKMVFLATNPLSYGMVRMYQMLYDDPHFAINICENINEAANLLKVDVAVINP
jgi:hypothetical protein